MKRQAKYIRKGARINVCCDTKFESDFLKYYKSNPKNKKKMDLIFKIVLEGHNSKLYKRSEPYGMASMRVHLKGDNDRIICHPVHRQNQIPCSVMAEAYWHKKSNKNTKQLDNRYELVSKYEYEILDHEIKLD